MTGNLEGDAASVENFLNDTWIQSLSLREWMYRFGESKCAHGWSPDQSDRLLSLYASIVSYFKSRAVLNGPLGRSPVAQVCFHPKFGWSLIASGAKAYLGKASIPDDLPIEIGRQTYLSGHATLRGRALLRIGSFTSIAEGLYCNTSPDMHPTQHAAMINFSSEIRCREDGLGMDIRCAQLDSQASGIEIGSDVWLGRNVRIFHGAKVADGCVIAEQSLVRGSTEPYGVYAGVPARFKKYRFPKPIIAFLMDVQWWNWSNERLLRNKKFFEANLSCFDGDPMELIVP